MRKHFQEVKFYIGCDYSEKENTGIIRHNYKVYCAMCGEEAYIDKSCHDRDDYEDYYCICEGSKLFEYILDLKKELEKHTDKTKVKFKILNLQNQLKETEVKSTEISKEIERLKKYE